MPPCAMPDCGVTHANVRKLKVAHTPILGKTDARRKLVAPAASKDSRICTFHCRIWPNSALAT
jgi:hypothetical protein